MSPVRVTPTMTNAGNLPLVRPALPPLEEILATVSGSFDSGRVTLGAVVGRFEEQVRLSCRVKHAVAVSSCTSGLMLAFAAMGLPEGSEVVVPSFTFAATVQAVLWNRLTPVYVDCLPGTMTVDPEEVRKAVGPRTGAICPVNVFGLPSDLDELEEISRTTGIPLIYDSAQGLGSTFGGKPAGGFGLAEVFSFSPTKVVTAVEGGAVTTNDHGMAERVHSMRDYGKDPRGVEMIYNGLSARMSELHASVGLINLGRAEALVADRLRLIGNYRERFVDLPGCRVQEFPSNRTASGNYFTLLIGPKAKMDRDRVLEALRAGSIESKRYFHPPVHTQTAFRDLPGRAVGDLPHTWECSSSSLALPLFSGMTDEEQERVCGEVDRLLG
jgi:dTDP-4-amino-4,6-dideoxygalactose transaminase